VSEVIDGRNVTGEDAPRTVTYSGAKARLRLAHFGGVAQSHTAHQRRGLIRRDGVMRQIEPNAREQGEFWQPHEAEVYLATRARADVDVEAARIGLLIHAEGS